MIQELLGVGMVEGRKIPMSGCLLGVANESTPSPCSPAANSASSSSAAAAAASTTNAEQQNLRCPRCDSTNTKFCYYNNYNLTQPRHFCKTCRRYWTQGGALRNVPIGGGCRKTKSAGISLGSAKSGGGCSGTIKAAATPSASDVIAGKSGFPGIGSVLGFDHDLPASPILWPVPQNSHLLSLLRVTQNPGIGNTNSSNPSHSLNPIPSHLCSTSCTINNPDRFKEEGQMGGSHLVPETSLLINALNARNPGVDPLSQVPLGVCNSLWRSSQYQNSLQHQQLHQPLTPPPPQQQQPNSGMVLGENPGASGIQELIQRLRNNNNISQYADYHTASTMVQGNLGSSSTSSYSASISSTPPAATAAAAILEPAAPVTGGGGEFGCWNGAPNFAWADMPNINGAFP